MEDCMIFVDETVPGPNNQYICFAGVACSRHDYEKVIIPSINTLKAKYFGGTDVVFHYTDMRKNSGRFNVLLDHKTRVSFWNEYVNVLRNLPIDILGVYFNAASMASLFTESSYDVYEIGFSALLDNLVHYLRRTDRLGQIVVESRTFRDNTRLLQSYVDYTNRGSIYYRSDAIRGALSAIGFTTKADNCIGLQIADIAPGRILNLVAGIGKDSYGLANAIKGKIYCEGTELEKILGFKNLLA